MRTKKKKCFLCFYFKNIYFEKKKFLEQKERNKTKRPLISLSYTKKLVKKKKKMAAPFWNAKERRAAIQVENWKESHVSLMKMSIHSITYLR